MMTQQPVTHSAHSQLQSAVQALLLLAGSGWQFQEHYSLLSNTRQPVPNPRPASWRWQTRRPGANACEGLSFPKAQPAAPTAPSAHRQNEAAAENEALSICRTRLFSSSTQKVGIFSLRTTLQSRGHGLTGSFGKDLTARRRKPSVMVHGITRW